MHILSLPPPSSPPGNRPQSAVANLMLGGASGTLAATVCYPLDTIRRRMQMRGKVYNSQLDAFGTIWRTEGVKGFYRGWVANSIKARVLCVCMFSCVCAC